MAPKLAYVMSRFPHLPETFILREMIELERLGFAIELFPILMQRQTLVHDEARAWMTRAHGTSLLSPRTFGANAAMMLSRPAMFGRLWSRVVRENRTSPNFLVRAAAVFPKAVRAAGVMRALGVRHIHAHYATHPALFAWLIHQLTGIRYSVTVHAHDIFVRTAMLATKLRDAAFIVAISEYNREHLANVVGEWVRDKVHIVHCGVDPSRYASIETTAGQRNGRFEIVSVGSLQPYKGFEHLVDACALLRDRGMKLRCRIVGGGEERARLEQLIAERRLGDTLELLGPRTQAQVGELLPAADCYVQPSVVTASGKMEGIPVALMEAMACGLPVVASRLSGIPELVRDGETGRLTPPGDAAALAQAIAAVHDHRADAMQAARAGRDLVVREFNLQANVRQLARLFEQVMS